MKRGIFILSAFLTLFSGAAFAEKFNANIFFPETHPLAIHGYVEWADDIRTRSDGELDATVYTGTVLLPPRSGLSGVRDGIAQVGYHAGVYTPAELPIDNAIQELGFNYTDPLVSMMAATEFNMTNADALQEWKNAGVVYGGGYSTPTYNLMCRTAVSSVEDLQGLRLRTAGAALSAWAESVGAVPVNVPSSEMYQGLEKGTIDCAVNAASDLKSRSLWDVASHTNMVPLGIFWSGPMWAYNREFWSGLSAEQRRILLNSHPMAMAKIYVGYQASIDEALAEAADKGVKVEQPSEELTASVTKFAETYVMAAIKTAKDKHGIANPESLFAEFAGLIKKWEGIFASVDRTDATAIAALMNEHLYAGIDTETYGR